MDQGTDFKHWTDPDITHKGGVPWHEAKMPPLLHLCRAQTDGWIGLQQVQRCACGATRLGGMRQSRWFERNSRRFGR